ncbi:MAG TPA: methyltransferase domain-containing protein [Gaiellaceae bacterium]|nr:methyltransferase domain-containing protein [Gaiellaceae bacterium]
MTGPRYDEVAEWYDATMAGDSHLAQLPRETALQLLGPPRGRLLDVGCGGGSHTAAFAAAGWETMGIDPSGAQLELARQRGCEVVQGSAESLPFEDGSFDAAVSMWTHTDIDDWPAAVREIRRVVRSGGVFVYLGVHPCFVGPHSLFVEGRGVPQLHPGLYRAAGRYDEAPGISPSGLRARVGASHLPLADFLQSFLDAGFRFELIEEPGARDFPIALALRCR